MILMKEGSDVECYIVSIAPDTITVLEVISRFIKITIVAGEAGFQRSGKIVFDGPQEKI